MIPALSNVDVYADVYYADQIGLTAHEVYQDVSDVVDDLAFAVAVKLRAGAK